MKKLISGLVSCALIFTLTACGATTDGPTTGKTDDSQPSTTESEAETGASETPEATELETEAPETSEETDANQTEDNGYVEPDLSITNDTVQLLKDIWSGMPEDQKFATAGGDSEHTIMDDAGYVDNTNETYLCNILLFPADYIDSIEEAASIGHMMNINGFTSGLYTLAEGTDTAAIASAYEAIVADNMWLCGIPEEYIVMELDENQIFIAYGFVDNITNVEAHLTSLFPTAKILTEGKIA